MRGNDVLKVARELASDLDTPARARSAVSRAYYGAYLEVREAVRPFRGKVRLDGYGSHANVVRLLRNCGVEDCAKFANELADLRSARERADYDMQANVNRAHAILALRQADAVVTFSMTLKEEPARSQLRDGLKAYLVMLKEA